MPSNELKQRKKGTNQGKQNEDPPETAKDGGDLAKKDARRLTCAAAPALDLRTVTCLVSLSVCLALTWFVLQQTTRFAEVEEKYKLLYRKTADIQGLENEIGKISRQLDSSEEDLQGALSSMSSVTKMEQDISSLHTVVNAMQDSERSVSHNIQNINRSFQNVTNVWKESLEVITQDIGNLKSDSKAAHNQITAKINEAEKNVKTIAEKLEDLEDSTRRNSRALERTENEDMERLEQHLKWNTKQVLKLEEEQQLLANKDRKLLEKITDYEPKAQQCEEHLPTVEHAVHSILRVSSDLVNTEKRIEDLTIQVFNMEDNMLKAISEILEIKQSLDALQVDNSILKLTNDLGVIKEMVKGFDGARQELPLEVQESEGTIQNEL
ncbi:inhibitor of nuclear factor kappa-B kinase-interacting protein isoform X1 [Amia ocellicauda]|uniref:inhibitor of nuclear factor kappa-B kinase-interacting protein isoform X1 n=1 Tax=Amia ocellicauda TaxID=2972642 RepID=UPI003464E4F3